MIRGWALTLPGWRWRYEPTPNQSTSKWGWGFHTVPGSIDPGDRRFRPVGVPGSIDPQGDRRFRPVGVVEVWKGSRSGDGTLSSLGGADSWRLYGGWNNLRSVPTL